jgi:DnaJ-class molecular chaperone
MDSEKLKFEIRRRLYAEKLRQREAIPDSLAEFFVTCPKCKGRGVFCEEFVSLEGCQMAALDDCDRCNGDGFVATK